MSITRGFGSGQALLTVSFMPPAMAARHGPLRNFVVNVTSDQNTGTPMHSVSCDKITSCVAGESCALGYLYLQFAVFGDLATQVEIIILEPNG